MRAASASAWKATFSSSFIADANDDPDDANDSADSDTFDDADDSGATTTTSAVGTISTLKSWTEVSIEGVETTSPLAANSTR